MSWYYQPQGSDGVEYIEALTQRFEALGCDVDVLKLVSESPSQVCDSV
ncbi:hypothetical protein MX850_09915 [Erysipelothrix sp. Poltava]|nr:hypothetical protein MX850_09915 [Erysipelothrix sp. Poltava]